MKVLVFTLSLLVFLPSWSQTTAQIDWSDDMDFERNLEFNTIIGAKGDRIFKISTSAMVPKSSIDVHLDVIDANTLKFVQGLEIINSKSFENFEDVILAQDRIIVFTSFFDRDLGMKVLNARFYDETTNTLSESVRVDEIVSSQKGDEMLFEIRTSPSGENILIYHDNDADNGNKVFNLKSMSNDLDPIWEKEIALNYKERMVNAENILMDNKSNVYILSSINPYGIKRSTGLGSLVNIKNSLFVYRPFDDKLKEYEFALSKNWINTVKMGLHPDGELYCLAYYTNPNDYKVRGFVMFTLDGNAGQPTARKMIEFSKEEYNEVEVAIRRIKDYSRSIVGGQGIYPGSSSHMNSSATEFGLGELLVFNDGFVLPLEILRRDERCTESFSDQQMIVNCQKHFLHGDVLLVFMNLEGDVRAVRRVEKMQHSSERVNDYFSYCSVGSSEAILILFNDDFRNLTPQEGDQQMALNKMNKAAIGMAAFDERGAKLGISLTDDLPPDVRFFPHENYVLNDLEFLLLSQKEKNYKFGKLSIQ